MNKLDHVNESVNENFTWMRDKKDKWQSPDETMERGGGDCEDLAFLKMHTLRILGYSVDNMWLQRCYIIRKGDQPNEGHMVLCVEEPDGIWMLDNRNPLMLKKDADYMFTASRYSYAEAMERSAKE